MVQGRRHVWRRAAVPLGLLQQLRHPAEAAERAGYDGEGFQKLELIRGAGADARPPFRRYSGAHHRAGWLLSSHRPLARVSLRRVSSPRHDGASERSAGRRVSGTGSRRADSRNPPHARSGRHFRRERLAPDRTLRTSAERGRNLYLDRKPVSVRRSVRAARTACERSILERRGETVDFAAGLERRACRHRLRDLTEYSLELWGGFRPGAWSFANAARPRPAPPARGLSSPRRRS